MIGKQLINNLFEFVSAMSRSATQLCAKRGETGEQEQWEKDNGLRSFNSSTLIDEYLELGNLVCFQIDLCLLISLLMQLFNSVLLHYLLRLFRRLS